MKQLSLVPAAADPDPGAMEIVPDTKDWTWVLDRPCPECGLATSTIDRDDIPGLLRANAAAWREVLARPDARARPNPTTWSPLEYAAYVRDVCRVYTERLHLMLTQDAPHYPNWDQDATAVEDRYAEQDPVTVARELSAAAEHLATRFTEVTGDQWLRRGTRSDGAHFTVDTFARYFIHDPIHHLHDAAGATSPTGTSS
ncbi:DinB family protein [Actinophytocola sp.]|uniref:DinB family protein n=1 Tax=Actinophytocola sp. TaxID=1872138 RepID=UPI00389AA31F